MNRDRDSPRTPFAQQVPDDVKLRRRLKAAAKRAILKFGCDNGCCRLRRLDAPGPGEKRFLTFCRRAYREAEQELGAEGKTGHYRKEQQ
jgi:hypothetical protein